ncbi:MAG: hypothetical protein A2076_08215 [Geobacteraceae bacterium GWC2_53_11]|nr:MAG: hypothetical protein A2076_08215 [Geobacteraceae bacterium GWC2_53_11]
MGYGNLKQVFTMVVFLLVMSVGLYSGVANAAISWTKTYSGGEIRGYAVQPTADGGYVMAGQIFYLATNPEQRYDTLVVKVDAAGDIQWQKTYGSIGNEYGKYIRQTADGGYIIVGDKDGYSLILKLAANGDVQWQKRSSHVAYSSSHIQQTKDGGYILAGSDGANNVWTRYVWVQKLDGDGNIQWENHYADGDNVSAQFIQESSDGGYLLAGAKFSVPWSPPESWVVKLDEAGAVKWQKTLGNGGLSSISSMQPTADGGCVVSGYNMDVYQWVFKLDTNGAVQWQKKVANRDGRFGLLVISAPDGGYLLADMNTSPLIVKLDKDGGKQWVRRSNADYSMSMQNTPDGGFVVSASFAYSYGIKLLKYESSVNPVSGCGFGAVGDVAVTDLDFTMRDTAIVPRPGYSSLADSSVTVLDSYVTAYGACMSALPVISVDPASLDFAAVKVGKSSTLPVTFSNTGYADLTISGVTVSGANSSEFTSASGCTRIIPGGSCVATINFTPVTAGAKAAVVAIASDDPKRATVTVPISATATVPLITVSTTALNFPAVELPGSVTNSVTVTNAGTADLTISSLAISGVNTGEFKISSNCSTVAPGGICSIDVNFVPASFGAKSAVLSVLSDDQANPAVIISLAATAADTIAPAVTASLSGTKGNNDWFVTNALVSIVAADSGSGVKEIRYALDNGAEQVVTGSTVAFTVSGDGSHTVAYRVIDNANNEVIGSSALKIDGTAPAITGAALSQPNANGWYNNNVTIHFSATDAVSGVAGLTADTAVTAEGIGQTVTGTAVDMAGNSASYTVSGINLDKNAPVITISGVANGATYTLGHVPTARYAASDALSGVAVSKGRVTGGDDGLGYLTYTVTATDKAGNTAMASVSYTVKSSSDDDDDDDHEDDHEDD